MSNPANSGRNCQWSLVRVMGAALLFATGAIHLDLYLTGYRTIPTIGWLFLLQLITAFALGASTLASRNRLVSAMGAGFSVMTLGGYLVSLRIGLFRFREVPTAAGLMAGVIEVAGFATLAAFVLRPRTSPALTRVAASSGLFGLPYGFIAAGRSAAAACTVAAAVLLGLFDVRMGTASSSAGATSSVENVTLDHRGSILTNAQGTTLYWFAPDPPNMSTCYGTCAVYWPPVTGNPVVGTGVIGTLGTTTRSGGTMQVTYDHHPLYTYVGDSAPGQDNGNNVNLNGGLWHAMSVSASSASDVPR